ncbi:MAG: hypothetical protein ACUVT9_07575 [Candidatus Bathycorpusculaceae bacterium]
MNFKSEYALIPFLLVDGVLIFGILILLQLDWIVNHTLYSYNLTFSVDWAVPYWTFLRLVFGAFFLAIIATTVLSYSVYRQVRERSMMPVYICRMCGSAWTSTFIGVKVEKGRSAPKFRFLKSCPRCNQNLFTE